MEDLDFWKKDWEKVTDTSAVTDLSRVLDVSDVTKTQLVLDGGRSRNRERPSGSGIILQTFTEKTDMVILNFRNRLKRLKRLQGQQVGVLN